MDAEEMVLTLKKNKLDMEHEGLLQDRNVIVITEVGIPITLVNIAFSTQNYAMHSIVTGIFAGIVIMGIVEWFRRRNRKEIVEKRNEIDIFIRQLQPQTPQ